MCLFYELSILLLIMCRWNGAMEDSHDEVVLNELRHMAMSYYGSGGEGAGVTDKMEEILNSMFYEKPPDVYGYLVMYICVFTDCSVS